ncbi:MAG TPA: NAD(P)H-dependent oxidoreductase [Ilumatobacteraceae bacterium]|nr:NAD(P)H-dependent oxidoreductase [Ilumatobacteraceae bacterium]
MRALVVVCHPKPDSFTHAMAAAATEGLERAGHSVEVIDLYALGFQPAMSEQERRAYHSDEPIVDPLVASSAEAVHQAEMLVFVYPTWWSSLPAMLKGWLEKTMVPGVAFVFNQAGKVRPGMTHIRRVVGISCYGSPRTYVRLVNDNGRRTLLRALRLNTGPRCRTTWLACYSLDTSTALDRAGFLHRITSTLAAL